MKSIIIKIIFCFCIVISMHACHTFEHENIFIQNIDKQSNKELLDKDYKSTKLSVKNSKNNNEMAPIDIPRQIESVKKLALRKKVKIPNANNFTLDKFMSWNEKELIKNLGNSHFIKEEGKLKNYQYHFKECFIDVFLLKKK